jgi:hypothetical protein
MAKLLVTGYLIAAGCYAMAAGRSSRTEEAAYTAQLHHHKNVGVGKAGVLRRQTDDLEHASIDIR